jgi:hypothetical protein
MFHFSLLFFPFLHFHPIFLLVSLFLYFLPAYLARNRVNFTPILLVNVLAGWTFVGWIVALVWAISDQPKDQSAAAPAYPPAAGVPQPTAGGSFFCSTCGKSCVAGSRFCSSCGAALPATQR